MSGPNERLLIQHEIAFKDSSLRSRPEFRSLLNPD